MKKSLMVISIGLGVIFNFLFWEKIAGISFPIFVILCLLAGYGMMITSGKKPARMNTFLLVPILFFSLMTIVRREPMTSFLNFSLTLSAMALFAGTYLNDEWTRFNGIDYVSKMIQFIGGIICLPWTQPENAELEQNRSAKKLRIGPILRGVALALPIWLVFLALLYSADQFFAERVDTLFARLNLENLIELAAQSILALLVAYLFSGAVLFAAHKSGQPSSPNNKIPLLNPFLGLTETAIIMGGVILLFGSFVIIQFQYFFSGPANIHIEGFTYAEYARRGFGEMVTVAVLSVMLLKGLSLATQKDRRTHWHVFNALSTALVGLVFVILFSAYQRLLLYESAYGFTRLRTYAHIFMVWLGLYMLALLLLEILKRPYLFFNMTLVIIAGFSLSLTFISVDRLIVNQNIGRSVYGEPLDMAYLVNLSSDAVPAMVEQFTNTKANSDLHEAIGATLVCFQQRKFDSSPSSRPWQSFHFSDQAALRALSQVSEELFEYEIDSRGWPWVVTSPSGTWFPCW